MTDTNDPEIESESPPPETSRGVSRRGFLGVAAGIAGGITVGTAVGTGIAAVYNALTAKPTINQEALNKEYTDLYTKIKAEKETAERDGKKLVILIGEDHAFSLSLLHNVMIADIACRLGIREFIPEDNRATTLFDENRFTDVMGSNNLYHQLEMMLVRLIREERNTKGNIPSLSDADEKELYPLCLPFYEMLNTAHCESAFLENGRATKTGNPPRGYGFNYLLDKEGFLLSHSFIPAHMFLLRDAIVTPGDPLQERFSDPLTNTDAYHMTNIVRHYKPDVTFRLPAPPRHKGRFDPKLEDAMAKAVERPEGHRLGLFGAAHLPFLYDALKKNSDLRVLAFNTMNQEYSPERIRETYATDKNEDLNRCRRLDEMAKADPPKITKLWINAPAPTLMDAYRMAMHASIAHREKTPGVPDQLTREKAEYYGYMIDFTHNKHMQEAQKAAEKSRGR